MTQRITVDYINSKTTKNLCDKLLPLLFIDKPFTIYNGYMLFLVKHNLIYPIVKSDRCQWFTLSLQLRWLLFLHHKNTMPGIILGEKDLDGRILVTLPWRLHFKRSSRGHVH